MDIADVPDAHIMAAGDDSAVEEDPDDVLAAAAFEVPAPKAKAAPKPPAKAKKAYEKFDILDPAGRKLGHLVYNERVGSLDAHCTDFGHAANRTLKASGGGVCYKG